jgi:hypothetical protein
MSQENWASQQQAYFDFQLRRIHAGDGVTSDSGLSTLTDTCLYQYMMDRTPEKLVKAQLALELEINGVNLDG